MIEITPVFAAGQRFLGIRVYLPKCTMKILFNMNLIILDPNFDLRTIEKKCPVPVIQCTSISFDSMLNQNILKFSDKAAECGIVDTMSVKEAITCIFSKKETL